MSLSLSEHYTQMWQQARSNFLKGSLQTDALIDNPDDDRHGITLLFRPDESTAQKIDHFLQEIIRLEPGQYYYPSSDLHLTVLSIISCFSGFRLHQINVDAYDVLIKEALQGISPIKVHFQGITASPSATMVQGFSEDKTLSLLRDRLRQVFKKSVLQDSIDSRYTLFSAHSTVIRFRKPLHNPEIFVKALEKYRHTDFGRVTSRQLELVGNDWYQRKEQVSLLKTYTLT